MKYCLAITGLILLSVSTVNAQADSGDFRVRVFGNSDLIPPTTPTLLSVTPVASTQIDLEWSSSTDNFVVAGYSVLRDGTPIATTTQLTFSDTSLTASTSYAYAVRAFDAAFNVSTTSNVLSTTTFDLPPPPSPPAPNAGTDTVEGTAARVVADDVRIQTGRSTSTFALATARPARIELRWGRTSAFELGYVVNNTFANQHAIELTDLEPGTVYEYELIGYTPFGVATVLDSGTFTTLASTASLPPANVSQFQAVADGSDVQLSWELPTAGQAIQYVRVVRSHFGFPQHPQDGAIVSQGLSETTIDEGVLAQYSPVYYTAFVVDIEGNVSSGAIALVYASGNQTQREFPAGVPESVPLEIGRSTALDEATSSIDVMRVTPGMLMPDAQEVFIEQGDRTFTIDQSTITMHSSHPFVVYVPASVVSGNLKSIIVTLLDPTDNRIRHSYLLRMNSDRTAYEAVIAPVSVAGQSRIMLEIYDFEAFVVARYQAPVVFTDVPNTSVVRDETVVFPDMFFAHARSIVLIIVLGFAFVLIWLLVARLRRGEDNGG